MYVIKAKLARSGVFFDTPLPLHGAVLAFCGALAPEIPFFATIRGIRPGIASFSPRRESSRNMTQKSASSYTLPIYHGMSKMSLLTLFVFILPEKPPTPINESKRLTSSVLIFYCS